MKTTTPGSKTACEAADGSEQNRAHCHIPRSHGAAHAALTGAVLLGLTLCVSARAANVPGNTASAPSAAAPTHPASPAPEIASLSFSGNSVFSNRTLQRAMDIRVSSWLPWSSSHGDPYSKAKLASGLSSLRSYYISHGYLRFAVKDVKTVPSSDGKTMDISITVSEGRLYTLSSVQLGGDNAQALVGAPGVAQALHRALPTGQPVTREGLQTAQRSVMAQLAHDGYPDATISPTFITDDQNAHIALTLTIRSTNAQSSPVHRNPVTGLPETPLPEAAAPTTSAQAQPPKTAAAPAVQTPPTPMAQASQSAPAAAPHAPTPAASATAQARSPAAPPPVQTAQATPPTPPKQPASSPESLDLSADKQRGLDLRAGFGYSTAERIIGFLGARFTNAFGKGHDLSASATIGQITRAAQISESDRWFTPGGVTRSTNFWYHSNEPFYYLNDSRFRSSSIGLTERFDIPITAADTVYIAPGLEHDWMSTGRLTPQAYLDQIQRDGSDLNLITLRTGWTHDMRDSAAFPTHGYITQGDVELGTGTTSYVKASAIGRYYHPLWRSTVLSLTARAGYGYGFGSHDYPIEKYFYAGGGDTVRGYTGNSLGPRDIATRSPLGGREMLLGSIEAITPLWPRDELDRRRGGRLVGLIFLDGGNVWQGMAGGTGTGGPRYSYGVGLGWQMPYGTLKLNLALPVKRHVGDSYQPVQVEFNAGF